MDLSKLGIIFKFAIIGIVYIIIFLALRIMYKDIKGENKRKVKRRSVGLEVLDAGENHNIKRGSVIPIQGELTIGRRNTNLLILEDQYVSGNHVKIYARNTDYIIEDLGSTNGTLLNGERLENRSFLNIGDNVKVGSALFKVIG